MKERESEREREDVEGEREKEEREERKERATKSDTEREREPISLSIILGHFQRELTIFIAFFIAFSKSVVTRIFTLALASKSVTG